MYKIRRYFETYSKKSGMVTKSHIYIENVSSYEEAIDIITEKNPECEIFVNGNFITTRRFTSSGVPVSEKYKIYKPK